VTISGNTAALGGGISIYDNSSLTLNNSIIWGNTSSYYGNEFYINSSCSVILNYCCYKNNSENVYNEGTFTGTNHNITVYPQFADTVNGDYRLINTSPCLDAGKDSCNSDLYDIRGIGFGRKLLKTDSSQIGPIDMGAYEYKKGVDPLNFNHKFVDSSATGANNGTNWADAFTSLQSALDIAISGDTIWVAKGTYYPSSDYGLEIRDGDTTRYYHFEMKEGVKIYGGFIGNENPADFNLSERNFTTNRTIFSGDIGTRGDINDNCYHVFYHPYGLNLTASAILDGVTITGGNANKDEFEYSRNGGGMYNKSCSPILTNVTITGNAAIYYGGGMYNEDNSSTFTNLVISDNTASLGGGIYNTDGCSPTFNNVTITKNVVSNSGGGIFHQYMYSGSSSVFNNSIIWGNTAASRGNDFFIQSGCLVILNYCCYKNNSEDVHNEGSFTANNHNITVDPQFADTDNGDYRLMNTSPCLDAGSDSCNSELYDIRGIGFGRKLLKTDTLQAGTIDMGAYEYKNIIDPLNLTYKFVDSSATGANNGTSWEDAFTSLQDALDIAISGDKIWVAKGNYYPSSGYNLCDDSGDSTRYYHFEMKEGVKIYGGFAGNEDPAVFNLNDRDFITNNTILSGDIGTRGDSTDNCYHIFYHPEGLNLTASALLDGMTITGGNADGDYPHAEGGGMFNNFNSPTLKNVSIMRNRADEGGGIYNSEETSPTLTNVTISENTAKFTGGGIYNTSASSPTLTNVIISNNRAGTSGGGMLNYTFSSPTLTNVTISKNSAEMSGGGMYNHWYSSPTLTNVVINGNKANHYGGGMYNYWYSSPTLTNVVINENNTTSSGGGINNRFYSSPTFTNVTICKNTAEEKGGGIYNERSSSTFNNSILWENTAYNGNEFYIDDLSSALLNYCCYNNAAGDIYNEGSFTATNHNITLNPRFANLTNSDYRLCSTSPCLDAGNDSCNSELYDIRGIGYGRKLLKTDSLQAGTIDMGAYEYKNGFDLVKYNMILYVDSSASGTNNGSSWINAFTSLQSALETAISGYTIWVAKGTYYPSSGYNLCDDSGIQPVIIILK
jgi:predicted outer membrane repeat protein